MTHRKSIQRWLMVGLLSALLGAGCVVTPTPAVTVSGGVATSDYQPLYYDGYVVYYDDYGRPYYYANGAVFWIPATYHYYGYYVSHWRHHRHHYARWYQNRGYRYRTYRRNPGYYRHSPGVRRSPATRGPTRGGSRGGSAGRRR